MVLKDLISDCVTKAVNRLMGSSAEASNKFLIGNTVQGIVDVNVGKFVYLAGSVAGNGTIVWTVPRGKVWRVDCGRMVIDTDATVANRYVHIYHGISGFDTMLYIDTLINPVAVANTVIETFIDRVEFSQNTAQTFANCICNVIFAQGDEINVATAAGVVGDLVTVKLRVREYDIHD